MYRYLRVQSGAGRRVAPCAAEESALDSVCVNCDRDVGYAGSGTVPSAVVTGTPIQPNW